MKEDLKSLGIVVLSEIIVCIFWKIVCISCKATRHSPAQTLAIGKMLTEHILLGQGRENNYLLCRLNK